MDFPPTTERVPRHTDEESNARIAAATARQVRTTASQNRRRLEHRLQELDHEWDIERTLEANAATVSLIGLALGRFVNRRLYLFPVVVAGFLLQHALQGWCPPIALFRRLGIRTADEIAEERYALKVIRGDFTGLSQNSDPSDVLRAVKT